MHAAAAHHILKAIVQAHANGAAPAADINTLTVITANALIEHVLIIAKKISAALNATPAPEAALPIIIAAMTAFAIRSASVAKAWTRRHAENAAVIAHGQADIAAIQAIAG